MMDAGQTLGRGISFPPRVGSNGRVEWSTGEDNIREAIRVILLTELRERLRLPEFGGGLKQFQFEPNNVATRKLMEDRIQKALVQWEPRIRVDSIAVEEAEDPFEAIVTIHYKLVATQARGTISMNARLGG
jgi:phage baseplate assembly protein W